MERRVKERLVGAAVLIASAIILNEMLFDPRRERAAPEAPSAEAPMKTYTFDLNQSPGTPAAVGEVDERAPPSETSPPPPAEPLAQAAPTPLENPSRTDQAIPESNAARTQEPERRTTSEPPPRAVVEPHPAPAQVAQPTSREANTAKPVVNAPVVTAPSVPTSRGWAVQLGSFASRATADRMVKDLAQRGQNAFVMPVKSGASTLYRVRIGPFGDRNAANDALREVKGQVANAAVVAHP